jgi:hypothetical protein
MSNVRSLADLNGDESDHDSDHNEYYAGGEKRCARITHTHPSCAGWPLPARRLAPRPILLRAAPQRPADPRPSG